MDKNKYCIIMAGGVGSRFWPISRNARPKQFIDVLGVGRTLIQITVDRISRIIPVENIYIVSAQKYKHLIAEQVPQIPEPNVLLEPYKRNTAPCIAYATYKIMQTNPDATVIVTPADHLIVGEEAFLGTITAALNYAQSHNQLFTIGIKPTFANTNYGYIQADMRKAEQVEGRLLQKVRTFTEKPDAELAQVFVDTGEFYWNSGIFIWNLKTIKAEFEAHLPLVAQLFSSISDKYGTDGEVDAIEKIYCDSPSISVDYGIMEKTSKAWVFLADFGWNDLGTWESLYAESPNKDERGTLVRAAKCLKGDLKGTVVVETDLDKLVIVKGLDNMMVIDTRDVLMVCPRKDSVVREILAEITAEDKSEYL